MTSHEMEWRTKGFGGRDDAKKCDTEVYLCNFYCSVVVATAAIPLSHKSSVPDIFGVGGGCLASHEMEWRTKGLSET